MKNQLREYLRKEEKGEPIDSPLIEAKIESTGLPEEEKSNGLGDSPQREERKEANASLLKDYDTRTNTQRAVKTTSTSIDPDPITG